MGFFRSNYIYFKLHTIFVFFFNLNKVQAGQIDKRFYKNLKKKGKQKFAVDIV